MKRLSIKTIAFSLACLFCGATFLGTVLSFNKNVTRVRAYSADDLELVNGVYQIKTAQGLIDFRDSVVNTGIYDANAKLMNDIDLQDVSYKNNWTGAIAPSMSKSYTGTFDGNGKTISNLKAITNTNQDIVTNQYYFGLFGVVDGGTIRNLTISNSIYQVSTTSSYLYLGGIVGSLIGTAENCRVYETEIYNNQASSSSAVGGIAGYLSGTISKCSYSSDVSKWDGDYWREPVAGYSLVGGIAGTSNGTIINSYNAALIRGLVDETPLSSQRLGGIAGTATGGSITNCFNYGHYEVDGGVKIGGIAGTVNGVTITDCYYAGTASNYGYSSGGAALDDADSVAKKLTDDEFKVKANFPGWSFGNIWSISTYFPVHSIFRVNINLDNQEATTAGTTIIYENKGDGFYLNYDSENDALLNEMTSGTSGNNPITIPTKTDKAFCGYYTEEAGAGTQIIDKDGHITDVSNSIFDTETTLYAKWVNESIDITYIYQDEDGNVIGPTPSDTLPYHKVLHYGQGDATLDTEVTKRGYTLVGYYTDEEMTSPITVLGSTDYTDPITLYVKWTANEYEITFDFDGGTGGTASTTATYGSDMPAITTPTKAGYTFIGYWSGQSGTGYKYYNSDGSSAQTWDDVVATTLYALWNANQYTVILDGAGNVNATYGQNLPDASIPADPQSLGRTFDGYYDGQNGEGNRYIDEEGHGCKTWDKDENNVTLYPYFLATMEVESSGYEGSWLASPSDPSVGVGRAITVTPIEPSDGTIYYGISAGTCNDTDITNFTYTEVGSYTVYFEVRKTGYTTYAGSQTVVITKTGSVVDPKPTAKTNLEYTNTDQELINAGTVDYGTMRYAVNTTGNLPVSGDFSETIPTGKLVGNYYVFYSSSGDANHNEYPISLDNKVIANIARVDRTDVTNLNGEVEDFLHTIEGKEQYTSIYNDLENTRSNVYDDAIVEDNVTASEVLAKYNELNDALSNAKVSITEYLINAIGDVTYPDSKDAIDEAMEYYESLSEEEKALIDDALVDKLNKDEELYDGADETVTLINEIPEPSATEEYYNAIDEALAAYNALTDEQKALLDDSYYETIVDNYQAREVIISIQNIGDIKYGGSDDSGPDISEAETLYSYLTDEQKALVNKANYNEYLHAKEVYTNVDKVAKIMKACPTPSESEEYSNGVDEAKAAYDALTAEEKAVLNGAYNYEKALNDNLAARDVINIIKVNTTDITYQGGKGDSLLAIIEAKIAYDQLSADQKALVDMANYGKLVDLIKTYNRIDKVADLIKSIPNAEASEDYYNAVEIAKNALDSLSDDERAILLASTDYNYEKVLNDNLAAVEVIKLIDDIGDVTYNGGTDDSLADIEAARAAYELLSDDQKALVERANYDVLLEAEDTYKHVDETVKLIQNIGDVAHGGINDSQEDLEAARKAYESLSEEEKALVGNYNDSYQTLDDSEQIYEVLELIDDIGTVTNDSLSEEKIKAAREAYESLSDEQKSKIGKDPLVKLEQSEQQIVSLRRNSNTLAIIIIISSALVLVGGGALAFLLIKRRKIASQEAK